MGWQYLAYRHIGFEVVKIMGSKLSEFKLNATKLGDF